jgi:hypothetical protein
VTSLQIDFKAGEVYAYLKDVPRGVARATSRALNSMNGDIRDDATRSITGIYNMRAADAKRGIKMVTRSGPNRLRVVWAARGGPIPLKSYGAKGGLPLGKRIPVTVQVFKDKRQTVGGGFIGPNGHVFKRVGQARKPIRKLFGPALPSGFVKEQVMQSMVRLSERVLPRRIESEMVRELRKQATGTLPKA